MSVALLTAALSAGGSFLSGMGASQASAKQARLQTIADNEARRLNNEQLWGVGMVNDQRKALGRELLQVPEVTSIDQHNSSWVDIPAMMAAAEAAGFNPVTFLNAGGLAAYTQGYSRNVTTRTGHNASDAFKMMIPEYALAGASQVPQQHSALSAFGGALSAGASAFGTQYRADQSYDAQMARVLAASSMGGMGLSDGNGFASTVVQTAGGGIALPGLGGGGTNKKTDEPTIWPGYEVSPSLLWDSKKPEVTNPFPPQWGWSIPPGYADAQAYEDAGTEIWSYPYSIMKGLNTVLWNTTGNTAEGWVDKVASNVESDLRAVRQYWSQPHVPNMTRYSGTPWSAGSMSP